jgi:hypothetical protein
MTKESTEKRPTLTDAERHKRFVEIAHKLEISDNADLSADFFKKLVTSQTPKKEHK